MNPPTALLHACVDAAAEAVRAAQAIAADPACAPRSAAAPLAAAWHALARTTASWLPPGSATATPTSSWPTVPGWPSPGFTTC